MSIVAQVANGEIGQIAVLRTARKLFDGTVFA